MNQRTEPILVRVDGVRLDFQASQEDLAPAVAARIGVESSALFEVEVLKVSLDARGRPKNVYSVAAAVDPSALPVSLPSYVQIGRGDDEGPKEYLPRRQEHVVVIGAGPSGLFCAHRLASSGVKTTLLDRGQPVEVRGRDVSGLMHRGDLKEDSNICFGEGGAGTWSDGKLYTRVSDHRGRHVLETIVDLGGPEDILVKGKPHLGTDRLVRLCKSFRKRLLSEGCEVRFGAFVKALKVKDYQGRRRITGVELRDGEIIEADRVVLAVGHSAREIYHHLVDLDVFLEPKPFAVGFRVEHRQELINSIQYGKYSNESDLPSADYRLATNFGAGPSRRGIYSFCMCPGGQIVPSHTLPEGICVNGMSHASRKGHWANSALVVTVRPEDFGPWADVPEARGGILAGMAFQHAAEREAFKLGGGGFVAPAQRLTDFKASRPSKDVRKTTYKTGIAPADLSSTYPDFVIDNLKAALPEFEKKMKGFLTDDALLIGVETRTSAPVCIRRDDDTLQSVSVDFLYPCGEGAGYGGGIVSAAIDGLRVAEQVLEELSA